MAKNNKPDEFNGFKVLTDSLFGNIGAPDNSDDDIDTLDDIKDLDKDDDVDDDIDKNTSKKDNKSVDKKDADDDDSDVDDDSDSDDDKADDSDDNVDVDDDSDTGNKDDKNKPDADLSEFEEDITGFFQNKLAEELGWSFDESEKFKTVKEFTDYLKELVEEASQPNFASEEIKKLNDFVNNGGSLDEYFSVSKPGGVNIDALDKDSETDLKIAIREKLLLQGYKDDRIKKIMNRYEENDLLQEEGEDAIEFLKEYKKEAAEKLLIDKQKKAEEAKKAQQKFYFDVEKSINNLNDIRGIKISERDKKELLDYIFKPESDGLTKYQKEYMSNVKNLIESAYFTKEGDKLINKAKKSAASDAYKDVYQKLKAAKGKIHSGAANQKTANSDSLVNALGKYLIK